MVRSLFTFTFVTVASACCFVSGQTQSATVSVQTPESETKSVLSETAEATTGSPESSGPTQIPAKTPESSEDAANATNSIEPNSDPQVPAAEETAITGKPETAISKPTANQVYSFQRDGIPTLQQRRQIRNMPIDQRPHRPFHFYGNTVRRRGSR